ncbi:MAG: hypothetical protein ACI9K9_001303, partial [Neolewinella sp.]
YGPGGSGCGKGNLKYHLISNQARPQVQGKV